MGFLRGILAQIYLEWLANVNVMHRHYLRPGKGNFDAEAIGLFRCATVDTSDVFSMELDVIERRIDWLLLSYSYFRDNLWQVKGLRLLWSEQRRVGFPRWDYHVKRLGLAWDDRLEVRVRVFRVKQGTIVVILRDNFWEYGGPFNHQFGVCLSCLEIYGWCQVDNVEVSLKFNLGCLRLGVFRFWLNTWAATI